MATVDVKVHIDRMKQMIVVGAIGFSIRRCYVEIQHEITIDIPTLSCCISTNNVDTLIPITPLGSASKTLLIRCLTLLRAIEMRAL